MCTHIDKHTQASTHMQALALVVVCGTLQAYLSFLPLNFHVTVLSTWRDFDPSLHLHKLLLQVSA